MICGDDKLWEIAEEKAFDISLGDLVEWAEELCLNNPDFGYWITGDGIEEHLHINEEKLRALKTEHIFEELKYGK
jgi:hypothetical protein